MFERTENGQRSQVYFPVDVKEEQDDYLIEAFLPGVIADDLDIRIVNETVTIQGEIFEKEGDQAHYLMRERPSGRFSRVLTLPDELDAQQAEADLSNGVLTLRVPKAEQARPRTIKVKTQ
ncbi:MAG: Hsp20/alpha crystallin family protein [Phycisphaerales bacterium]|nr:Hsp20/alpha crystallin family protein [Phycisphaerales bacterium]